MADLAGRDLTLLPKAHLHVHLESTVRPQTLRELADAHGVDVPARPGHVFADFGQFAEHNALVRGCLRTPEDFARVAEEFCADEAAGGTRYAEVTFTAAAHGHRLGDLHAPLAAVLDGLAAGSARHGIECRVILDHSRRRPLAWAADTRALAARYADRGVVAIGVAGDEAHPLAPFAEVFQAARRDGIRLVHHAGEHGGPASIREAVTTGRADRIGHGIRILDDRELVAAVRDQQIPLEVCPSSNVALGLVPTFAEHPLPALHAAGLQVSVNTDIPDVAGTTLTREYELLRSSLGYDDSALADLAHAAVDASFAPGSTKRRLHGQIRQWLVGADR